MKVISVIKDQDVIKKILKHLGLWEVNPPEVGRVKPRPPPKATGPLKTVEHHVDYSVSQVPASDMWLAEGHVFSVIDPEYLEASYPA
jgi:hypothetical protein